MTALIQMFSYHFMQRALIVGVLVSLCAALLGVSLVTGTLTGFVASLLFRAMKNIHFTQ